MPFTTFENAVRVTWNFIYDGQHCQNGFVMQRETEWTNEQMHDQAEAARDFWLGALRPYVPPTCSLVSVGVRGMESTIDPGQEIVELLPAAGSHGGPQLPNHVTFAVKWITPFTGRSYRGRTYHVGMSESQVAGNTLDATYLGQMQAEYNAFINAMNATGALFSVASRWEHGTFLEIGHTTPILAASINPIVDSQRRRLPERGA